MNTAYERLTFGIKQLTERGRCTQRLRNDGGVCLVGSMLTDNEIVVDEDGTPHSRLDLLAGPIHDAVTVMGFNTWVSAFCWNDGITAPKPTDAEVLARLEAARDRILHQEADKANVALEAEAPELVGVW